LGHGVNAVRYEPTTERREWEIEEKVRRLLQRFPRQ